MRVADWLVLCATLAYVVLYGLWRGRGCRNINHYLLADKTMPWYAMALSIMATQANAVTFISIKVVDRRAFLLPNDRTQSGVTRRDKASGARRG